MSVGLQKSNQDDHERTRLTNAPAKASAHDPQKAYIDLAERIFVMLSSRVYGTLAGSEQEARSQGARRVQLQLAEAFEQATRKPTA